MLLLTMPAAFFRHSFAGFTCSLFCSLLDYPYGLCDLLTEAHSTDFLLFESEVFVLWHLMLV